ncbi:MAG: S24 family peptidase [Planctomycetota bacterium]
MLRSLGSVSAGFPSPAQGYEDEPLDLNELLIRHPAATFFFRVRGDSLKAEGIRDGSLLVVDRSRTPGPGVIVVADWNGEREVCRMPSFLDGGESLVVWGVVTAVITRLRP